MLLTQFTTYGSNYGNKKDKRPFSLDFLLDPEFTHKWVPQFLRRQDHWKVYSGRLEVQSAKTFKYLSDPSVKGGENVSIVGSKSWKDYIFRAKFTFLTHTLKPPEGGLILYFLFRNIRNYYSFHFALFKHKIEFIKRFKGMWTTMAKHDYRLETEKEYCIEISSRQGIHQCQVDGRSVITVHDTHISRGSVGIGVKYCDAEFTHLSISFL